MSTPDPVDANVGPSLTWDACERCRHFKDNECSQEIVSDDVTYDTISENWYCPFYEARKEGGE